MRLARAWPLLVLAAWALAALVAPWFEAQGNAVQLARVLATPDAAAPLGNDDLGRPVLERLIAGARNSLLAVVAVVSVTSVFGTVLGAAAAAAGGWTDRVLHAVMDLFLAFPGLLLAIALAALLGPGLGNAILALAVIGWVGYARLARAQVLVLRERDHVLAARALGVRPWRILARHMLPLIAGPFLVETTFAVAAVVMSEAGLSFLGLGVQPPEASWGAMIRDGTRYLLVAPHLVIAPGVALAAVVLAANVLGDAWRDRKTRCIP